MLPMYKFKEDQVSTAHAQENDLSIYIVGTIFKLLKISLSRIQARPVVNPPTVLRQTIYC